MATELKPVGDMKKGSSIVIDGVACRVLSVSISRPGKHGHAKVNLLAEGMFDGKKRQIVMPGHDPIEVPIIEKRNAQILSVSDNIANAMDSVTFETIDLKVTDDIENGPVTEGCEVVYWEVMGTKVIKQVKK